MPIAMDAAVHGMANLLPPSEASHPMLLACMTWVEMYTNGFKTKITSKEELSSLQMDLRTAARLIGAAAEHEVDHGSMDRASCAQQTGVAVAPDQTEMMIWDLESPNHYLESLLVLRNLQQDFGQK